MRPAPLARFSTRCGARSLVLGTSFLVRAWCSVRPSCVVLGGAPCPKHQGRDQEPRTKHQGRRYTVLATALTTLLCLVFTPNVLAQAPTAAPLAIDAAVTDEAAGTLIISGNGFGARPFVTLDLVPLNIQLALQQRIVVVVPVDQIPPGAYLLTVTRGPQPGETASTDVQIGPRPLQRLQRARARWCRAGRRVRVDQPRAGRSGRLRAWTA